MEEKVINWKKVGGGSLRLKINGHKRIIKPGQVFKATPSEVSMGFRDVVIPLDELPKEPTIVAPPSGYEIKPRKGGGFFDIVDKKGKVINEKALRREPAEELLKALG